MRCVPLIAFLVTATASAQSSRFLFRQPNASAPAPIATVTNTGLQVSGVTPGARVYGFNLGNERKTYYVDLTTRDTLLQDTDNDGALSWILQPIPARSLWFVVDLNTGGYATAVSSDFRAKRLPLRSANVARTPDRLTSRGGIVEFILVRPGIGAWQALVPGGSTADLRLHNNAVTVSLTSLAPGAGTTVPPPPTLQQGDVIILINTSRGEYRIGSLDEVTP